MAKFALFLGCNVPWRYPDIEQSIRKTLPRLGVELQDIENYSCCTAPGILPSIDETAWLAISARNIALAEDMGLDIITGCNGCYSVLNHALFLLSIGEKREETNKLLSLVNREYKGTAKVLHAIHVLYRDVGAARIRQNLKRSLDGFKVSLEIGCHQLWPSAIFGQDDPVRPRILGEMCQALGAEVQVYSKLLRCCGGSGFRATALVKSFELVKDKLGSIREETEADMIVTTCPSCFAQMDDGQQKLREIGEIDYSIPVFYYTQLLALCMGFDPKEVAAISDTPRDEIIDEIIKGRKVKVT